MIPSTKPPRHLKMRAPVAVAAEAPKDLGPPKIEIRGLNFYYGEARSLHNITCPWPTIRSVRSSARRAAANRRCSGF